MTVRAGPVVANRCEVAKLAGARAVFGEPVRFQLLARDKCGNLCGHGGQLFSVRVRAPLSATRQPEVHQHDNGDGSHTVEFLPPARGKYTVLAALDGTALDAPEHVVAVV